MSLPSGQQRALNRIEKALAHDSPGLGPLFAIFARLVGHEAMPVTERVTARLWRRWMWPAVVAAVGMAMVTLAFTLSLTLPSPQACPGTVIAVAAHMQPVPARYQPACATKQSKPSKASQRGAPRALPRALDHRQPT